MKIARLLLLGLATIVITACGTDQRGTPAADAGAGAEDGATSGPTDAGRAVTDSGSRAADGGRSARDGGGELDAGPAALDAGPPPEPCEAGATYTYVLNFVDLGQETTTGSNLVPGFDLDGRVSDSSDALGCRRPDYTSPAPDNEPGVDSELGPLAALFSGSFDVAGELETAVTSGQLLLMIRVSGVDDLDNDDCVDVEVMTGSLPAGVATPELGSDGRLKAGQTFDVDASSLEEDGVTPRVRFLSSALIDGRVHASTALPWLLDIPASGGRLALDFSRPRTRFDLSEGGLSSGVIGGGLDVNDLTTTLTTLAGLSAAFVRPVIASNADLDPVGGTCRSMSASLVYEGVPAVEGSVR